MALPLAAQPTWRRAYGALDHDAGIAVRALSADRFGVAGSTGSFGAGASDIYLLLIDADGELIWSRTIGGIGVDVAADMALLPDEGWIIAGTSTSGGAGGYDGYLVRTDANGEVLWQRWFGGSDWDFFHDVHVLPDGDVLVSGQTYSFGNPQGKAWLLRVDSDGQEVAQPPLSIPGSSEARATIPTADGGLALAGAMTLGGQESDAFVLKLDAAGVQEWLAVAGGDSMDVARDLIQTADGGFSIVGATRSFSPWVEAYHVRFDASGAEQWHRNWGQINDQESFEHFELPDGRFMTIGYTRTSGGGGKDMFLLQSQANGDFAYGRTFGGSEDEEGYGLAVLTDGFICVGSTSSYGSGGTDVFAVRTDLNGATASETVLDAFDPLGLNEPVPVLPLLGPNPSPGFLRMAAAATPRSFSLLDPCGRLVEAGVIPPHAVEVRFDAPNGMYIMRIRGHKGDEVAVRLRVIRP
ncbi:MAG: hypothetical protein H6591_06975 [Flavobacteriales bacterium]|nr:hypothetical protein [Flavobacteriales bacterium]